MTRIRSYQHWQNCASTTTALNSNRTPCAHETVQGEQRAMPTSTVETPVAEPKPSTVAHEARHLFRPGVSFNLLLAIENDDNARAAIRVTDALTARGAVPSVIHATELMAPVAGTPNSMLFFAEAVLGEQFHQGMARSLRALISATTGRARPWAVHSVTGEPSFCITQEAREKDCDLLVIGIHHHGAFEQAIGENTATRVMARAAVPVLGVRPTLSGLPRRIMVATDFGNASRESAHLAANLADPGGCVILVHASLPTPLVEEGDEGAALIQREGMEQAFLQLAAEISEGKSIRVETV